MWRIGIQPIKKVGWQGTDLQLLLNMLSGMYTGCHRRKGPNFGRVFLVLNYTDITQNTYIQS